MTTRRSFITTMAGASASLLLSADLLAAPGKNKLNKIGYISGIISKEIAADWKKALKQTAEFGFTEIETGKYLGSSEAAFLAYCKEIGIKPVAGGVSITEDEKGVKKILDSLAGMDMNYAVSYWPWLTSGPFSLEDCKRSAELLNKLGLACKQRGMKLCWHNHNKEFIPMEKGLPFDYLMENTDKDLVKCEMDIYWVAKGGADPLTMLKKYPGRYRILHVKDMAPGPAQDFECPGSGIIDFPAIFREAAKQNIKHYFVERDNVPDGMACLKASGAYLKNLEF